MSPSYGILGECCPHSCLRFPSHPLPKPSARSVFSVIRRQRHISPGLGVGWSESGHLQVVGSSLAITGWGGRKKKTPLGKLKQSCMGLGSSEHNMHQLLPPKEVLLSGRQRILPASALKPQQQAWPRGGGSGPPLARGKTTMQTLPAFAFGPWEPACTLRLDFWLPGG